MKKFISVVLSVLLIFGSVVIGASAADDGLKVIVASDLHLSQRAYLPFGGNTAADAYAHVPSSGQLTVESNAIITAFFEKAAATDSDFVFLSGDLTNAGTEAEHILMVEKLAAFEAQTGKKIYMINGNHDLQATDIDTYRAMYYQFGYDDALAYDTLSLSYAADINDEYRLIAIDSVNALTGAQGLTDERFAWIQEQCEKAVADGRKIIAMMHHNLLEHFILSKKIHTHGVVNNDVALAELLASSGAKYIFTGHTHDQDITSYTASTGDVIYDVVTNSINGYPCQYREVTFGNDVVFEEKTIEKVDTSLFPEGLSQEAVSLAAENFREYTKKCMWKGLRETFESYLKPATLKSLLKLNEEENKDFVAIFDKISTKLCTAVKYPLYEKDAQTAGESIEALVKANGDTLKASGYKDLIDLVITIYQAHCVGDENYPLYSTELDVLVTALTAVLNYTLADLTAEEYTVALEFICAMLEVDVPSWVMTFASSGMSKMQGVDMLMTGVVMPLMTRFTVDSAPADNNVTLPGYGKTAVESESFMDKVRKFFNEVAEFFRSVFFYFQKIFNAAI